MHNECRGDTEFWQRKRAKIEELELVPDEPGVEYTKLLCKNADCKPLPTPKYQRTKSEDPEFLLSNRISF